MAWPGRGRGVAGRSSARSRLEVGLVDWRETCGGLRRHTAWPFPFPLPIPLSIWGSGVGGLFALPLLLLPPLPLTGWVAPRPGGWRSRAPVPAPGRGDKIYDM